MEANIREKSQFANGMISNPMSSTPETLRCDVFMSSSLVNLTHYANPGGFHPIQADCHWHQPMSPWRKPWRLKNLSSFDILSLIYPGIFPENMSLPQYKIYPSYCIIYSLSIKSIQAAWVSIPAWPFSRQPYVLGRLLQLFGS